MGIKVTGGVKVPQGKFSVYVAPPPPPGKTLWGWGVNNTTFPALGDGTTINRSSPVQIGALADWSNIACSFIHSLAIKTDGSLWAWGRNLYSGNLGDGTTINRSSPVQIGGLTDWRFASGGRFHSHAIKTNGTLWAWGGSNFYLNPGLLGDGTTIGKSSPIQIGALTDWAIIGVAREHTLAVKTDGTLWAWGDNGKGRLGLGDINDRSSPVQVGSLTDWVSIAGDRASSLAIKTDGSLWSWGSPSFGQLGDGTTINRSSPVQIGALTDWAKIAGGYFHSLAVKTDGTLWAWGKGTEGRLGDGTFITRSSPVQIGATTDWSDVSAGEFHSLAIKTDGTIWAWGRNFYGELGDGTNIRRNSPIQIGATTDWLSLKSGAGHSLALKTV